MQSQMENHLQNLKQLYKNASLFTIPILISIIILFIMTNMFEGRTLHFYPTYALKYGSVLPNFGTCARLS